MPAHRIHGRSRRRGFRRAALAVGLLLLIGLAPALAHAQGAGADSVRLGWSAPGDDGAIGRATSYEVRLSTAAISDANWASATLVPGVPSPANAGTRQQVIVRGLTQGTTYYFALKTTDDAGNVSPISNIVRWDWVLDTAPPATPTGLTAAKQGTNVHLHWAANSEPDLAGYKVYRGTSSSGPWTLINAPFTVTNDYVDTSVPAVDAIWYRISATDASSNESGRTGTVMVSLTAVVVAADSWRLDPPYPNPVHDSQTVNLPMYLPSTGGELQLTDDAGRLVRRLDLGSVAPGQRTMTWDGLNDAGRPVVPGVYTAWLIAGGSRTSVRLVRVP